MNSSPEIRTNARPARIGAFRCVHLQRITEDRDDAVPLEPVEHDRPLFVGEGPLAYACPHCGRVLCRGIWHGDLAGLVLRCRCRGLSSVPTASDGAR